ncbi:synaptonemal complex central element protein 2 isoform X2 [Denticeps clupeoides]|nr:synaptonemal complex central element protein 2-like isoform X2 [Denticeps clupeoides]
MGDDNSGEVLPLVTLDDIHECPRSEDSGISDAGTTNRQPADIYDRSFPLSSRIDEIGKKAQDLIDRINEGREMDQKVMRSFEDSLAKKLNEVCEDLKEQMFRQYEEHSLGMEVKLQELSEVLKRSSQLSIELQEASQTLSAINTDLQHSSNPLP